MLPYLSVRTEYEAALFTIVISQSKQIEITQIGQDFRTYFYLIKPTKSLVDSKYMQNDHQQTGYKLLGLFLDEHIAKALPNLTSLLITCL